MYQNKKTKLSPAFTIVELLIVIVIIGILAAITVVSYNSIQNRSRAAAIADGFKKIDKAFQLKAVDDTASSWWLDNQLTGTSNPYIEDVISNTNLKNYIQSVPSVSGLGSGARWIYDNDNDTYSGCDTGSAGVNVIIWYFNNTALAQRVDNMIDDGNLSCGKLRYSTSGNGEELRYSLSKGQSM